MHREDSSAPLPDAAPHDAYEQWLRGGHLEGVHHAPGTRVRLLDGDDAGATGTVTSLQALAPEPLYVVALDSGVGEVAAFQSALHPES